MRQGNGEFLASLDYTDCVTGEKKKRKVAMRQEDHLEFKVSLPGLPSEFQDSLG